MNTPDWHWQSQRHAVLKQAKSAIPQSPAELASAEPGLLHYNALGFAWACGEYINRRTFLEIADPWNAKMPTPSS